ncbi:MAG: hypothetical protein K2Y56_01665 [Methylobacterium sp.]|uniref:hypothetical protein n=1 Tax=Methylobacterium sp. TaxID=409 RepID=UPI0025DCBC44|nr:hypothetical protein [Methylobacterium sp.]MBX9930239.1 hypothetical protein [Methylobacterium sp.]
MQTLSDSLDQITKRPGEASWLLFRPPQDARYRVGQLETGLRQVLFQARDGYLLQFAETL